MTKEQQIIDELNNDINNLWQQKKEWEEQLAFAQATIVQLREATQGLIKCLELLDQHNKIEKPQPSVCIRAIRDGVAALSTPPPPVVPKEVADKMYEALNTYTNRTLTMDEALTAYEQATKQYNT